MNELKRAEPVALRGQMTKAGWRPENSQWRDHLVEIAEDGELIGRNPMEIPVEILEASGHPHRSAQRVLSVWGGCLVENPPRGARGVREHCLACAENKAEVRKCLLYNCPCWPYRMGHSPYDARRGKTPTFGAREPQKTP